MKRQWLRLQPVVWTLALTTSVAAAQSGFPNKPVRIVHGFTPGGISDLLARSLGAQLATSLGQQILVEPRPGAGTTIASDHIAKSPGDGYTLFLQDPMPSTRASTGACRTIRCAISRRSR